MHRRILGQRTKEILLSIRDKGFAKAKLDFSREDFAEVQRLATTSDKLLDFVAKTPIGGFGDVYLTKEGREALWQEEHQTDKFAVIVPFLNVRLDSEEEEGMIRDILMDALHEFSHKREGRSKRQNLRANVARKLHCKLQHPQVTSCKEDHFFTARNLQFTIEERNK